MSIELNQQLQPMMQAKVTPKQIAANYILQMSSVELQEAIAQELDENPALEMQELPTCPLCGSPIAGNYCTECMPRKNDGEDGALVSADDLPGDGATRLRDEDDEFDPIARAGTPVPLAPRPGSSRPVSFPLGKITSLFVFSSMTSMSDRPRAMVSVPRNP